MTVETFFANFGHLADAPNGVQKLREFILQLAVQGELVSQDSNEEPASVLLERIEVEKGRLVKEGKIKKQKQQPKISRGERPYVLPASWAWNYLGNISNNIHYGYTASADHNLKDVRLLRITDIQNNRVNWESVPGCQIDQKSVPSYALENGDLLIARTGGTIGKTYLVENVNVCSVFASYLIRVVPNKHSSPRYLKIFAESPLYWGQLYEKSMGTGQPNVNGTALSQLKLPLPPLEEQKRIVAKVDQLMALCNELEDRQQKQQQGRVRLNNAALDALLTASEPDEFTDYWQRISTNFDLLYDHPETIAKLRAAILQLAVQGKLVSQDSNDEPASVLLERIKVEIAKPDNKKRGRRNAEPEAICSSKTPFVAPENWAWARFGHVADIASNLVKPDKYQDAIHLAPNNIEKGNGRLLPCRTIKEDKVRSSNHLFYPGQIVYSKIRPNLSKVTIVDFGGLCSADMYPINAHILSHFLLTYMLSETFLGMAVKNDTRVAMPKINQEELNRILVPVPPVAEQKRIVVKVDQLMALCDELEAKLNRGQQHSEKLMEFTVRQLLVA